MRRLFTTFTTLALGIPLAIIAATGPTHADTASYTVQTLHFLVDIGSNSLGDPKTCDVIGDLYTPASASSANRVPAILATNGFGGSKDDQAGLGKYFASNGYEVLSYSGLGFGGSGCKITLDDPSTDGVAASQLISFLGGEPGVAFYDAKHTQPAPALDTVQLDQTDNAGQHVPYDPRVGMVGGSYGGEIQFAAASIDPRLDTIVPIITWNDLSYSLAPNNTTLNAGVTPSLPGTVKLVWGLGFSAEGVADGIEQFQVNPARIAPCPNFATFVCAALATGGSSGYFLPAQIAALQHASVVSYMKKIQIPTLLMQGETDTLFNLNEAVATYQSLKAQGTPVQMVWQSWGHSSLTPAPGEIDLDNPDPATQYDTMRIADWFDHYLKGSSVSTGPDFSYFQPWVSYTGIATPAYATASSYPVGSSTSWYLSGKNGLASSPGAVQTGSQQLVTTVAGTPTAMSSPDAVGSMFSGANALIGTNAPGTTATWSTPALSAPVDVAGIPSATLKVAAAVPSVSQAVKPGGKLVLFLRVVDVAPDGTSSPIDYEIAPVRIDNVRSTFTVKLPAIVHQFAAGHRIGLEVEGDDLNYRGGLVGTTVTIASGAGQVLSMPVVSGS